MKKKIYVTGAVLRKEGKILAAKRGNDKSLGGFGSFQAEKLRKEKLRKKHLQENSKKSF